MSNGQRYEKHERLMTHLAQANGVDLDLALQMGQVTPDQLDSAVLACTGCSSPDRCQDQIERGQSGIPAYCRNGDLIRLLSEVSPCSE